MGAPEPPATPAGAGVAPHQADVEALDAALKVFLAEHRSTVESASRVINPLLDLWALAARVDRSAARPVEVLLTVLVRRSITTADELGAMVDAIEAAIASLPASAADAS